MKLVDSFPALDKLLAKMGASKRPWAPNEPELDPFRELLERLAQGVEVGADEIEWSTGGLLSHKGQQVILYIKDTRQPKEIITKEIENAKKFHVYHCKTLESMIEANRFERYVVTQSRTGLFSVISTERDTKEKEEFEARLHVCKNCLDALSYNGYSRDLADVQKRALVSKFDIGAFFAAYSTFFPRRPARHEFEIGAQNVGYVKEWDSLSRKFRASRNWICEDCGVDLSSNRSWLHAHHVDGDPRNNTARNLQAVCALCHASKPFHGHMKASQAVSEGIRALRLSQKSKVA